MARRGERVDPGELARAKALIRKAEQQEARRDVQRKRSRQTLLGCFGLLAVVTVIGMIGSALGLGDPSPRNATRTAVAGVPTATVTLTVPPSETPRLTDTPLPTETSAPSETPRPTDTPFPTNTSLPTETALPLIAAVSGGDLTITAQVAQLGTVQALIAASQTPPTAVPTETPIPTSTPLPTMTSTPLPTRTPVPTRTARPPQANPALAAEAAAAVDMFPGVLGSTVMAIENTVIINVVMISGRNNGSLVESMALTIEGRTGRDVDFHITMQGDNRLTEYIRTDGIWRSNELPPMQTALVPLDATSTPYIVPTLVLAQPPISTPIQQASMYACNGVNDLNCSDFPSRSAAQQHLQMCGNEDQLDGDEDGRACEN